MLRICQLLLWFSGFTLPGQAYPGVTMRVSQKWLDYVCTVGMDFLHQMLQNDHLPDISESTRMFGSVDYKISGVFIEEFELPKASAFPVPSTDVHLTIENAKAKVYGNWDVKHWLIKDRGSFTLLLSGISIEAQVTTFKDSSDRPSVFLSFCNSEVKKAKLHLSGGASWLYNLFTVFLETPIKNNVNKKLCPKVDKAVSILKRELATFQVTSNWDGVAVVNYGLISRPKVQGMHIDLDLKGIVHQVGAPLQESSLAFPITLPEGRGSMIYVGLSESFFNSLANTYFKSNVLKLTISQEQFPHAYWLRTGDYGAVIPQLNSYYPISQAMVIMVNATNTPVVRLMPKKVTVELYGILQALVVLPYFITKEVYSINLIAVLERSLAPVIRDSVLRGINEGLSKGIPMPSLANITLQESTIAVIQGGILVSADMYYIPWKNVMDILPPKQRTPIF
ncbi:BPI fold-containing family C protein-like isoform X2 [Bombina bombina]|uniref:BPI fold-containing family C protein-like isoform X2 n=1 Tax=Bombina bombina TaxID=8345 RepID=UPI00235A8A95|nr:BPI fold-containing family C protein-like isoform X2 [Bombina bombina]